MEDEVDSTCGVEDACIVAHVADIVFQLVAAIELALVVLLLLVTAENPYLADIRVEERTQHSVAEGAGSAGDQQDLAALEHSDSPGPGAALVGATRPAPDLRRSRVIG